MQTLAFILEIIGTVAFAISGAMVALKKHMDIFGVAILGCVTAVGGGVIRDLVLGITPPTMFESPVYMLLAVGVSLVVFIPAIRRALTRNHRVYELMMRVMDAVGLGIFTVMGIDRARGIGVQNVFLLLFVGVITGVGGGVIRDVMAGDTPYIFVRHVYACASIAGAMTCILLIEPIGVVPAMVAGAAVVLVLRLLAAHFKWSLPRA